MPEDSTRPNFIEAAERIFKRIYPILNQDKPDAERRHGGQMFILRVDGMTYRPHILSPVGVIVDEEKGRRWQINAIEKAVRLSRHNDTISWLTRDPDDGKYGGAIRASGYILSFSGFPELADEAFMVVLAEELGLISNIEAMVGAMRKSGSYELYEKFKAAQ